MIRFNNISSRNYNLIMTEHPIVQSSNEKVNMHSVNGRLGSLIEHTGIRDNIKITCTFTTVKGVPFEKIREAKRWLRGTGHLSITDNYDTFYEVQFIECGDMERQYKQHGRFNVVFYCLPYEFTYSGLSYITPGASLHNPYDECMPIYKIAGEGICVLTVNGKSFEMNVGQNVTIDTALMLAYRTDENLNATVKGNYEDLYLKSGNNTISITDGFELIISPRWGYLA